MRRTWCALTVFGSLAFFVAPAFAEADGAVTVEKQAELLVKVALYDRNFAQRAGARVNVLLVVKRANGESVADAARMEKALARFPTIAGLPHTEAIYDYELPSDLAAVCRTRRIAVVFLERGFGADIGPIRNALDGLDVLTASAVPDDVPRGIVLGFDASSGTPKLLIHLGQARRQNVTFKAELLKIAKIY